MKQSIVFTVTLVFCFNFLCAQKTPNLDAFFKDFKKIINVSDTVNIYLSKSFFKSNRINLAPDTFYTSMLKHNNDGQIEFIFKPNEKKYLMDEFFKNKTFPLDELKAKSYRIVPVDSLRKQHRFDFWEQYSKLYNSAYYTVSNPVFFRNNKYCLMEYGYRCGSLCGETKLVIFKKIKGIWKEFIYLALIES